MRALSAAALDTDVSCSIMNVSFISSLSVISHSLWLSVAPPLALSSLFLDNLWYSRVKLYLQDINGDF